jgi:CRISPR/Cas system CSM-associated protein Csm3 (group 7 of RAMP superfamily)
MARQISSRIKITGTIKAQTPLHVGGLGTDPTVDLSLAVNGQNQIYIPGTSLAGAFRNWMEDHEFDIDALWGFQKKDEGHASFIIIDDAVVTLPEGAIAELRDHVGIDRIFGTASDKTKFDRAILPKGSRFPLEMTIDIAKEMPLNFDAIEQLLSALKQDGLRLGAAKTRGLGLIKISDLQRQDYDFRSFKATLAALKLQTASSKGQPYEPQQSIASQKLHLSIDWEPIGAVMVKSGQDGVAVDILPLASRDNDQVAFVLPGSAIKGALRSQAERILRTVLQVSGSPDGKPEKILQEQLEHPQLDLTQWLFGKSGTGDKTETISFGRGALMVDDCFCQKQLNPQAWQAVEQAIDDPKHPDSGTLRGSLDAAGLTEIQQAFHVAIDRWTGGAADQMLYSALEPFNLQWHPIELTLDLKRIPAEYHPVVKALLLLTLRDLAAGRIPLGYGVNRGYGSLKVNKISLNAAAISEFGGNEISFSSNGAILGIDLTELNTVWQTWLNQAKLQEVAK